jgi:hypothetical protein
MSEKKKPNQTPSPVSPSTPEATEEGERYKSQWLDLFTAAQKLYPGSSSTVGFMAGREETDPGLDWLEKRQYIRLGPSGELIAANEPDPIAAAELSKLSALLTSRINEVISESRLAFERITKDQEQINALTRETRAMLERLRA